MAEKRKIHRVVDAQGTLVQILPETSAEQVTLADTANNFTSTNVEGALAEVMQVAQTGGVTGVKGDAESTYRKGNVNITKANIGLGNVDNTADANKSVASAVKATQDGDGNVIKSTYATKTEVTNGLNGKLDKTGGSITGNLTIGGNLAVNGTTTTIDSTTLQVKDKLIEVAHGNTTKLTSPAGLVVPKYDGTNSGALVFDGDGMAQVGKVVLDAAGNIDTTKSGLQTLATRTNLVGGNLVQYDSTNKTLVDSGKKVGDLVTTNTPQTITGKKTFSDDLIVDSISTSNNLNVFSKSTINNELVFGSPSGTTSLTGSEDRPTYKLSDGTRKDIALLSDVQGTKVDNAKYADSAGYVKNSMVYQGVGMNADANYSNFVTYNGSAARSIKFYKYDFQMLDALGSGDAELSLRSTGVTAGAYSAVTVDAKGRVTAGGKSIEWGTTGQTAPSDDLMVGGLFFELQ
jgi:hypothetical protein